MRCEEIRTSLADYLYRELSETDRVRVEAHLDTCPLCQHELDKLRETLEALDTWQDHPTPPGLWDKVRAAIAAEEMRAFQAWRHQTRLRRVLFEAFLPYGAGIAVAAGLLYLLREYLAANQFSDFTHVLLGVLWGGLFGALFHLAFTGKVAVEGAPARDLFRKDLKATARVALLGIGLACLLSYLFPVSNLLRSRLLSEVPGQPLAFFLIGMGYAILALFLGSLVVGIRMRPNTWVYSSFLTTCLFVLVMAPGLAIICVPFTVGIYLSMLAGSALGAALGAFSGFTLGSRVMAFASR